MQDSLLDGADRCSNTHEPRSIHPCTFLVGTTCALALGIMLASCVLLDTSRHPMNYADLASTTLATLHARQIHALRTAFPGAQSRFLPFAQTHVSRLMPISPAQAELTREVDPPITRPPNDHRTLEGIKASLLKVALLGGRGVWSRAAERDKAASLVRELESNTNGPQTLRDGVWELVVSDLEPFRASVFFLALAEAVEANLISGASDGALTVHSLATGGGEIGRVAHVVENNASRLHSLVELKSGSIPSLPFALSGTVISSGELTTRNEGNQSMYALSLKNTTVQDNKLLYGLPSSGGLKPGVEPNILSWIGDQFVPSGDVFSSVLDPMGGGQTALLHLSYSDDEMMVWRTPRLGGHFFCFLRGQEESWPAMEELRTKRDKATQSPIGSAFALGMLNPFFSRRAGLRK